MWHLSRIGQTLSRHLIRKASFNSLLCEQSGRYYPNTYRWYANMDRVIIICLAKKMTFSTQLRRINPSVTYGFNLTIPIWNELQYKSQDCACQVAYKNSVIEPSKHRNSLSRADVQRAYQQFYRCYRRHTLPAFQAVSGRAASFVQTEKEQLTSGVSNDQYSLAPVNEAFVLAPQGCRPKSRCCSKRYCWLCRGILKEFDDIAE